MTGEELRKKLCAPFDAKDVEWRVTKLSKDSSDGLVVPFITSRAIQNRLDDVVGPFRWRTRFIPWHQFVPKPGKYDDPQRMQKPPISSQLCGVSIYDEERKEWVEKIDGAENTDVEAIKGGISDSFKRAAVLWGVGRYLYEMRAKWVHLDKYKQIINLAELVAYYNEQLSRLGLCMAVGQNATDKQVDGYLICGIQPAPMQGYPNAAWIEMVTPDEHRLKAFSYGIKPGLANGVHIRNAKLEQKNSANGLYFVLQDYQQAA